MPRSVLVLVLGLVFSLGTHSACVGQSPEGARTMSDTVSMSASGTVTIDNQSGSVDVRTWDRSAVGYQIRIEPNARDSVVLSAITVDASVDGVDFDLSESWSIRIPGIITISPGGTSDPIAHYRVRMPATAQLEVDDHDSNIQVSDVHADVEIASYSGDVTVDSVAGMLSVDTYAGSVQATGLRGGIDAETHSGSVDAAFEDFSAPSSIDAFSGTVYLRLPPDSGFRIVGDLDEIDLTVAEAFGSPVSTEEGQQYGDGGPALRLDTFSAPIKILTRSSGGSTTSP